MGKFSEKQIMLSGRIFRLAGFGKLSQSLQPKDNIRITTTHYVKRQDSNNFDRIVRYLNETRKIITPKEFFRFYKHNDSNTELKGRNLLMTFDDGLYSSYTAAKEILSKYGIKAIFFVPTMILELKSKTEMLSFATENIYHNEIPPSQLSEEEYVVMSKDDLLDLKKDGHYILPHTHTHCDISKIKNEEGVKRELIKPKHILEELLGEPIEAMAFPDGSEKVVSSYAYAQIKKFYRFAFPALVGVNHTRTNPYFFHRDCIHAHYPLSFVKNILDGVYDPYYYLKMRHLKSKVKAEVLKQ